MRIFLPALAVVLLVASCRRAAIEDTDTGRNTIPANVRLMKIISIDTAVASPLDTVRVSIFQYNANGLLTGINETTNPYRPATGPKRPGFQTISFFYNGADTKPYKSVGKIWGGNTSAGFEAFDTCWYSYNSAGKKIKDSTVMWSYNNGISPAGYGNTLLYKYAYYNDSIVQTGIRGSTDNYTVVPDTSINKAEINGAGQVTKTTYSPQAYGSAASDYITYVQYNYATAVNPLSRLNIFPALGSIPLTGGYGGHFFGDKHFLAQPNVLERIVTNYVTHAPTIETGVITTNSYDLPLSFTSSNTNYFKVVFVYNQ